MIARNKSWKSIESCSSGAPKSDFGEVGVAASSLIRRSIARLRYALGYVGCCLMISSSSDRTSSTTLVSDESARRTKSLWRASRSWKSAGEIVGCGGRLSWIAHVSFAFATEEGSVSGSNSAFSIRLSLTESVVLGVEIAISVARNWNRLWRLDRNQALWGALWLRCTEY